MDREIGVRTRAWLGVATGVLLCAAQTGCAGEPRVLSPRTPPPRQMPAVQLPNQPIAERHGRLVLGATDGPMRVAATYDKRFVPPGGAPAQTRSGELCTTPCVVDLPVGRYRLYFSATESVDAAQGDVDEIEIASGIQVYRLAPGRYQTPSIADQAFPVALLVLSGLVATTGAIVAAEEPTPGFVLLGAGSAGAVASGIWTYDASRAEQQEGASTFWRVPFD